MNVNVKRTQRALLATVALFGLVACASQEDESFHFQQPVAGKADGPSELLSPTELNRLNDRLTSAIAAAEARIAELEKSIKDAETQLNNKQSTINSLVSQIESRKVEVQNNYNNSVNIGLLGALFGFPLVTAASLAQAWDQDSYLQSLNSQLSSAKSERDKVNVQIASYQSQRAAIVAQLMPLKARYAELKNLLQFGTTLDVARPAGVSASDWSEAERARARITTLKNILDNANQQIGLLQKLLAAVSATNSAVDAAVTTVKALAAAAAEEAEKSNELFQSLLEIALSGDPNAAAKKWLEDELASRTRAALSSLDWPVSVFVKGLLDGDVDASLEAALIEKLTTGGTTTTTEPAPSGDTTLTTAAKQTYGKAITFSYTGGPRGTDDWIGVYSRGAATTAGNETIGYYLTEVGVKAPVDGSMTIADVLPRGQWTAYYFIDDSYVSVASVDFVVE